MYITSYENKLIKEIIKLREKKFRDFSNQFVIEGKKFVDEIPSSQKINKLIVSESFALAIKKNANVFILPDKLFSKISDTKSPQGIMAICEKKNFNLFDLPITNNSLIVAAENINDPGNLGTLIRSCAAFNADALLLSQNSVDLYNPKVLRACTGNIFKLNIATNLDFIDVLPKLKNKGFKIFASSGKASKNCFETNLKTKSVIVIGNEANGICENVLKFSDELIKIPMANNVESLNISAAASILLYEAYLQRR